MIAQAEDAEKSNH
jgi:hypothetical protein